MGYNKLQAVENRKKIQRVHNLDELMEVFAVTLLPNKVVGMLLEFDVFRCMVLK